MLYDWTGNVIATGNAAPASPDRETLGRRLVSWEPSDRADRDASRGLTPSRLDAIYMQANAGDPRDQARLAEEICEKDWDVAHALQTRTAAVLGLDWCVEPEGMDDSRAGRIAKEAEAMLRAITGGAGDGAAGADIGDFEGAIEEMMGGLLPGYSCLEILWQPGGAGIDGFAAVPRNAIWFNQSMAPLIVSRSQPSGALLAPNKFIFHRHRARSGDPTRGGLVRPIGWMFLFGLLGMKDCLRFVEKFGMPFVSARVDENAWKTDREKIAYLIRNFGSDGGAVFSKAVEIELLNGADSAGDVYFRLMEYMGAAKTKVILGQTATSGDSGGFSKGQAQENVRKDLLQADCSVIERTVRNCILAPWVMFNHGPDAPVPMFRFDADDAEDLEQSSKVIVNLSQAGFEADEAEVSAKFGMTFRKKTSADGLALRGERPVRRDKAALALSARRANDQIVQAALKAMAGDDAVSFLDPVSAALEECLAGMPEADGEADPETRKRFDQRLTALLEAIPRLARAMNTSALEEQLARAMFAADTNGRMQAMPEN